MSLAESTSSSVLYFDKTLNGGYLFRRYGMCGNCVGAWDCNILSNCSLECCHYLYYTRI